MPDNRLQQVLGRLWSCRPLPVYKNFEQALADTKGYEDQNIIQVVSRKTEVLKKNLANRNGQTTVVDRQTAQNMFVLSHVWAGEPLNVLDIGGACGANYFLLDHFLPGKIGNWSVLETPSMVAEARRVFQNTRLTFVDDIEQLVNRSAFDLLLGSGIFQYLPSPMADLDAWRKMGIPFVYFTRTTVGIGSGELVVTKQIADLASHGPGPLPEGFINHKTSQPMTIIPYETLISSLSGAYVTEFVFKEDEEKSMRLGSRVIRISNVGLLLRMKQTEG